MVEFMYDFNLGIYLLGDVYYNGIPIINNIETLNFVEDININNIEV